jgi:hypothetical protein
MSFFTPFAFVQSAGVSVDADAQAYINQVISVGGTLSTSQQTAIYNLYSGLKSNGLYSEIKYMYPFMGGISASHAISGITPTNSSYTITWTAGLAASAAHTSAGVTTVPALGYGTLGVSPSTVHSSVNNVTLGAYVSTATTNDQGFLFGYNVIFGENNRYQFNIPFDSNNVYFISGNTSALNSYNNGAAPTGRWIGSRTTSTAASLYKNGSSVNSTTNSNAGAVLSTNSIQFFSNANTTSGTIPFNGVVGFLFGGNGLSGSQVSTLDGIISTFLTAIGR